jgi:hypothetical protein
VVRWRRGAAAVSQLVLTRDGDRGVVRRDSIRFGTVATSTTPPLAAGVWRGTVDGTPIVLPVSPSREFLPRAVTLRSGTLNPSFGACFSNDTGG